jgi:hypothetical protein
MRSTYMEPMAAAPLLLRAFRKGPDAFGIAARRYTAAPRIPLMDAGSQECLELLDHLVDRLRDSGRGCTQGLEDACILLLEHLAARIQHLSPHKEGGPIQ